MKNVPYETAGTLIYDLVASNRNATRASLHSLGFRKVELATSFELLGEYLENSSPDLLLCEVTDADNDVCGLVQSMRQGKIGNNPFIVVMATTWRRDASIVSQVLNSGADDLVIRPISTAVLGERIRALIERRKKFVVTTDYVGPDRRREPGRTGAECVEVPNTLKIRTADAQSAEEVERQIAESLDNSKTRLNLEKLHRDAVTLHVQSRMLAQKTPGTQDFFELLPRAASLSTEIKRRAKGLAADAADPLCDAIADAVQALLAVKNKPNSGVDFLPILHQLGTAALGLGRMFAQGDSALSDFVAIEAIQARSSVNFRLSSHAA